MTVSPTGSHLRVQVCAARPAAPHGGGGGGGGGGGRHLLPVSVERTRLRWPRQGAPPSQPSNLKGSRKS